MTKTRTTYSENETAGFGRELARSLAPGTVVLLFGDLSAGKTAFVRGLAEGLGVNPAEDRIFLRGDTSANYGAVMRVMGLLSAGGYSKIGLITQPEQ